MDSTKPCAYNRCSNFQNTTADAFSNMPLAMAYVPWQTWQNVYDGAKGLKNGSIFEELVLPFLFANPACKESGCDKNTENNISSGHHSCNMNSNMNQNGRRGNFR